MPRQNNDMVRTNIYLPRQIREVYKGLSEKKGVPMAELLREDLTTGLKARISRAKAKKNAVSSQ